MNLADRPPHVLDSRKPRPTSLTPRVARDRRRPATELVGPRTSPRV